MFIDVVDVIVVIPLQTPNLENSFTLMADGKWMCRICCAILGSKTASKLHLQATHLKEKNFACQYCNRRFSIRSNALRHERKCTGENK